MKNLLILLFFVVLSGLIGWQIHTRVTSTENVAGAPFRERPPVAVEVRHAQTGTIRDMGVFTGTLHPGSRYVVAPKISGRLEKLYVNVGDRVQPGQLLAVLDEGEYAQQLEQARAELEVARAQVEESKSSLETAGRELERVKELRRQKIASESELDGAEADFMARRARHQVALAHVAQRRAALQAAEVRLSYTRIHAGGDGTGSMWVIGERFVDEGALLASNSPIVSVLDIGTLTAVVHVIEKDYPKIRVGHLASISTAAFPQERFTGEIARLAPLLLEASRQARVEIRIHNRDARLKPGMFIRAEIEFNRIENALMVTDSALVRREGVQGVFTVDTAGMKARFTPVTTGIGEGNMTEILKPRITDPIVTLGQHLLEHGSPVFISEGLEADTHPTPLETHAGSES